MKTLKFRVLFDNVSDKKIFRDIKISDESNFELFYMTILEAFDLSNDQMASFFVSDEEWNKGEEISLMDMSFDKSDEEIPAEMSKILLKEKLFDSEQHYILVYDFLSMWIFLIELQEIEEKEIEVPEIVLAVGEIPAGLREQKNEEEDFDDFDLEEDFDSLNGFDDDDDEEDYFDEFTGYDYDY